MPSRDVDNAEFYGRGESPNSKNLRREQNEISRFLAHGSVTPIAERLSQKGILTESIEALSPLIAFVENLGEDRTTAVTQLLEHNTPTVHPDLGFTPEFMGLQQSLQEVLSLEERQKLASEIPKGCHVQYFVRKL